MKLWPLKIIAKLVLSKFPFRHKILRNLGIFKHGRMDDVSYAHKIFKMHFDRAYPQEKPQSFTALELGPGDSVASALIAKAYGAEQIWLVDAGRYASEDMALYKKVMEALDKEYGHPLDIKSDTFDGLLTACGAHYLTDGLESLKSIPSETVDFIWSHSVLEHVRHRDFEATMIELKRILKPDGFISHNVDIQDHLDRSLNNLRFPRKLWENEFFAGAGFYTNRIGYTQALDAMRGAGFNVISTDAGRWEKLPVPKHKMDKEFQHINDDELRVRTYNVLLR